MKKKATGLRCKRSFVIVTAILMLVFAMTCISYAATDGEVFDTVRIWIDGKLAEEGSYTTNPDGSLNIDINQGDNITIEDGEAEFSFEASAMKGSLKVSKEASDGESAVNGEVIISEIIADDEASTVLTVGDCESFSVN